jgi:very-long-chain enoyl-CoA reductase
MITSFINTNYGVLAWNAMQCVALAGIYQGESENPAPYSKFAASLIDSGNDGGTRPMIPSKLGMLIIYVPATIVAAIYQCLLPTIFENTLPTLAGWMLLAHFTKRDLEVLFLHKYSGQTELNAARTIGFYYALTTLMISLVATPTPTELGCQIGLALFAIGSFGNFYHHSLLAQLRSSSANKKYSAPRGGLFNYVAAPHYMFELVAWLGIAVASHQITGYLTVLSMTLYLSARSYNQNQWNKKKFGEKEWPSSRKNLVPFVY